MAVLLAEILGTGADRAVLPDQRCHDIIDRFEFVGLAGRVPSSEAEDVVSGFQLRLRHDGQQILVAVGGDEVNLSSTFSFSAHSRQRFSSGSLAPGTQ